MYGKINRDRLPLPTSAARTESCHGRPFADLGLVPMTRVYSVIWKWLTVHGHIQNYILKTTTTTKKKQKKTLFELFTKLCENR